MHVVHIGACSLVNWTASSGFSVRACLTAVQQQPVNLDHVKSAGPSCLGGALSVCVLCDQKGSGNKKTNRL